MSPDASNPSANPVVWRPGDKERARSRLLRFVERHGLRDVAALTERASADPAWFWDAAVRDIDWRWYQPYRETLDLSRGKPWARWFIGGTTNMALNAVDKHADGERAGAAAVLWEGEDGETRRWSFADLRRESDRLAHGLQALGVGPGDRVGLFLPMLPETVAAIMAVAKLGAIFIPIFSGYGAEAVATRLADSEAKVLITADGFYRRGTVVPMKRTADAALALAPSVERVVVVRRAGERAGDVPWDPRRDVAYDELVAGRPPRFDTQPVSGEEPLMLIYTSGTTGRPKGTVHTHAGFPLKAAQDLAHCFDLQEDDVLYWITDIGWMMGPWQIMGGLALGATILLYEGSPDHPGPDRVWALCETHGVTVLGVSPTLIRSLMPLGEEPVRRHDLSRLRAIGSTGEPWNPEPWRWTFEVVGGGRIPIINYSGGTEISGGILSGLTVAPLKPCAFAGPVPGMAVDVVDETGRPVRGAVGELVIRQPWPGMTRGFWRDPDRYLDTYWSRIPDLWVHGDWAYVDEDGFWYIQGRSDDTLKVAGKRVGPAEVESALVAHPAVREAAAIGVPDEVKGEAIVAFCILRPEHEPGENLRRELKEQVASVLGKPFLPKDVRFVDDLPRTRNAKIMRRVVRAAYLGQPAGDLTALENPAAVEAIRNSR
ncbi:MAG: AMP-binding protein [Clostridia bacterium]|nr:AMP-binding protein [Clostridia bacterium]